MFCRYLSLVNCHTQQRWVDYSRSGSVELLWLAITQVLMLVAKSYLVCNPTFGLSWISFLQNECMQKLDHGGKELPCLQPHFWPFLDQLLKEWMYAKTGSWWQRATLSATPVLAFLGSASAKTGSWRSLAQTGVLWAEAPHGWQPRWMDAASSSSLAKPSGLVKRAQPHALI